MTEKYIKLLVASALIISAFGVAYRWFTFLKFLKKNNWKFDELEKRYPRTNPTVDGGAPASLETRFYFHDPIAIVFLTAMAILVGFN